MMEMRVAPEYHALRVEELELTSDYLFKVQEEREAAREERERLREERKAEQELAAERERLDKERSHYENTIASLRQQGKDDEAAELEARVAQIDDAIEARTTSGPPTSAPGTCTSSATSAPSGPTSSRSASPAASSRSTGSANSATPPSRSRSTSTPSTSPTTPSSSRTSSTQRSRTVRVNQVNLRREFFFATPTEVRDVLATKVGNLLEFTEAPEATQYFQSHGSWPPLTTPGPTAAVALE